MSNIYEALEQAQREKNESDIPPLITVLDEKQPKNKTRTQDSRLSEKLSENNTTLSMEAEMFCLFQNIECLLPDSPEKTILFIGPQGDEGVSTIVSEFARMAAVRLNKTVLIMDAAHHNPSQHMYFDIKGCYGWKDAMGDRDTIDKAYYKASNANVFLSPIFPGPALIPQVYDHSAAISFLEELKDKFDLVLIDSSPAITSPDSMAISRFTDGVVLVMEAERTRMHVIESVKNKIERNGGKILGIILNKRKVYIPDFIYKRLH